MLILLGGQEPLLLWGRALVRVLGLVRVLLGIGGGGGFSSTLSIFGVAVLFVIFVLPIG